MLLKLLKYDFRAMWHQFGLIWVGSLLIGAANRFLLPWRTTYQGDEARSSGVLGMIAMLTLFAVFSTMFVLTIVFIVRRFYKGLLTGEGYLMHTLPVRAWHLVASKLICAVAVSIASAAVVVLTLTVMVPVNWMELLDFQLWRGLFSGLFRHMNDLLFLSEVLLMLLSLLVYMISEIYLAIAAGHLFRRRRVLMSVAAWLVIDTAIRSLMLSGVNPFSWIGTLDRMIQLPCMTAVFLIPAALFLYGAVWILENKLNLD